MELCGVKLVPDDFDLPDVGFPDSKVFSFLKAFWQRKHACFREDSIKRNRVPARIKYIQESRLTHGCRPVALHSRDSVAYRQESRKGLDEKRKCFFNVLIKQLFLRFWACNPQHIFHCS